MIAPPFTHPFDDDKLHEECGVFVMTNISSKACG